MNTICSNQSNRPTTWVSREKGAALLVAMVVTVLLAVLALSLTTSSIDEMAVSLDFEAHEGALMVADSGLSEVKNSLRGKDLSVALSRVTDVPVFLPTADPPVGSYADRNPIFLTDARNVDFDDPPPPTRVRAVAGFMTPPAGIALGAGRYFARIFDNHDELPLSLLDDPNVDRDDKILARVVGVRRGAHAQRITHGTTAKNAISVVEAVMKRDLSLFLPNPLLVYGPEVVSTINGAAFYIDGYDHAGMTAAQIIGNHSDLGREPNVGVGTAYDDPNNGDGSQSAQSIYDSLNNVQKTDIVGSPGDFGPLPSLADMTDVIRNNPDAEAENIFSPDFWFELFNRLTPSADRVMADGANVNNARLGTVDAPEITVASGDLSIGGSSSGAGLLLVRGEFDVGGDFEFDGIILALGGLFDLHGNQNIRGGVLLTDLQDDGNGNRSLGVPSLNVQLRGNWAVYYASDRIMMALRLLPMVIESWREVTGDIEPVEGP